MRARVAVAVVVALIGCSDDGDEGLAGYRIEYDVHVSLPGGEEMSTREVRVQRPFAGSSIDSLGSGAIAGDGHVLTVQPESVLDNGEGAPGVPPGDVRFDVVLDDLVRLGLVEELEDDRRIAGRSCTTYRTGAPLGDPVRAPSDDEYVEWCIDGAGLLLEERWYLDGALLRQTTATSVEVGEQPASAFEPPADVEPNPIAMSTRDPLPVDEPVEIDGFELEDRWRVVTSSETGVLDIAFVDVYVRGIDSVVVERRESSVAGEPASDEVVVSERGTRLEVMVDSWLVTVSGTLSVADLRDFHSRVSR